MTPEQAQARREALLQVEDLITVAREEATWHASHAAAPSARDEARAASRALRELLGKVRALREGGA